VQKNGAAVQKTACGLQPAVGGPRGGRARAKGSEMTSGYATPLDRFIKRVASRPAARVPDGARF